MITLASIQSWFMGLEPITLAVGAVIGAIIVALFTFVRPRNKKLKSSTDVLDSIKKANEQMQEANKVLQDLYSFFEELQKRGL